MLKIDKEQVKKLKQLDRIEYRQKKDYVERIEGNSEFMGLVWTNLIIFTIMSVFYYLTNDQVFADLSIIFVLLFFLTFTLHFLFMFCYALVRLKLRKELDEEYFKVEVKK